MNIINLLATDNYIVVNKELIREIGLEEAIIVGDLASMFLYLKKENKLSEDEYFYYTVEDMQNNTSLSDYQQRKALQHLKDLGIIEIAIRDMPAKRFIKINVDKLQNLFTPSSQKIKEPVLKKLKTNNIIISNDIIINNNNLSKERKALPSSTKKSLVETDISKKAVKPKKEKVNNEVFIINNLKKHLFSRVANINICDLLGKWIEELYQKGKGIGSNALDVALDQLDKIEESKREEVIKKATLNGWRDFSYITDKDGNKNKFQLSDSVEMDLESRKNALDKLKNSNHKKL